MLNPPAASAVEHGALAAARNHLDALGMSLSREANGPGEGANIRLLTRFRTRIDESEVEVCVIALEIRPSYLSPHALRGHKGLTLKEAQIACMLVGGQRARAIAAELHNSIYTIRRHIERVYAKLGVHKREDVAAALRLK